MEKDSVDSDIEQASEEPVTETVPVVKPKRKLNLTDEQRAKRAENMKKVALARIEKSRLVNAEVADKVKAIHKEAVQKGKKIRMKKAIEIQHQNLDSDSESKFFDHSEVKDEKHDIFGQLHKIKIDKEGLDAHQDRKTNGFRLFGKYYQALWD